VAERQLSSRSLATAVEAAPRDSGSFHRDRELKCNIAGIETHGNGENNAQIEVQIGGQEEQTPDKQVNNPQKSDDKIAVFSKQLQIFMKSVREGFDNLRSEIHSDNNKLAETLNAKIKAEISRLFGKIESDNK